MRNCCFYLLNFFCAILILPCSAADSEAPATADKPQQEKITGNRIQMTSKPFQVSGPLQPVDFKPIAKEKFDELLNDRINGGLGNSFRQFANMFVVGSQLSSKYMIGLVTASDDIANTQLSPAFPPEYKPTFQEFFDQIALQTSSKWAFEPTGKFFVADKKLDKPVENCVLIEFSETKREKPYEVKLPRRWQRVDRGSFEMHVGPAGSFPAEMDVYQMGSFSAANATDEAELRKKLPGWIVMDWAKRVKPDATEKDLSEGKVGQYPAVCFEAILDGRNKTKIRWREWGFVVGNRAYMLLSTTLPEQDAEIFPLIKGMIESFRIR